MVRSRYLPIGVGVLLSGLTLTGVHEASKTDRQVIQTERRQVLASTAQAAEAMGAALEGRASDLAALFNASDSVSSLEFSAFTEPMLATSAASSLAWVPIVSQAQRPAFERRQQFEVIELTGPSRTQTAPARARYAVTTYLKTPDDNTATLGVDNLADPARREALERAERTASAQSTGRVLLGGSRDPGFVMYVPVYGPRSGPTAERSAIGFVAATFRFAELERLLEPLVPADAQVQLRIDGEQALSIGRPLNDVLTSQIQIAGQRWEVRVSARPTKQALGLSRAGGAALFLGLLTVLITGLTRQAVVATRRSEELADLRSRERDQAQARLSQVFEGSPIGMAVIDRAGTLTQFNRALCGITGHTPDEVRALGLRLFGRQDDDPNEHTTHPDWFAPQDHTQADGRTELRHAHGHLVWVEIQSTVLLDADEEPSAVLLQVVDIADRVHAEQQLQHLADHDPLTGLLNRRSFGQILETQIATVQRYGAEGALLVLDLDHFKAVNDSLGHHIGDVVLTSVADTLRASLRSSDTIGRLGGDEFAILLPKATEIEARIVADKLVRAVRDAGERLHQGETGRPVTTSVGVTLLTPEFAGADQAVIAADRGMYEAKANGRDRFAFAKAHRPAPSRAVPGFASLPTGTRI